MQKRDEAEGNENPKWLLTLAFVFFVVVDKLNLNDTSSIWMDTKTNITTKNDQN